MKGIAKGSGQDWIDIVALNVRSEVSFPFDLHAARKNVGLDDRFRNQIGLASPEVDKLKPIDGCTAFSWRDDDGTFWSAQ